MKLKYFTKSVRNKSFNRLSIIDTKNNIHKKMTEIFTSSNLDIKKDTFEIKKTIISANTSNISTTNNSVLESGKKENNKEFNIRQNISIRLRKNLSKDLEKIKETKVKKFTQKF